MVTWFSKNVRSMYYVKSVGWDTDYLHILNYVLIYHKKYYAEITLQGTYLPVIVEIYLYLGHHIVKY